MTTLHDLRARASLVPGFAALCLLACASPATADPKPLSKEEQERVDAAIDKGVAFLKRVQTKQGDFGWKMYEDGQFLVGQCALPAYALLESGVPADDPAIQKAAAYLRPLVRVNNHTYELALAILFFDRLGDPKDKPLIQGCALRLIAGQHRAGGWAYLCPSLNEKNALDLLNCLAELSKRMKGGQRTRGQALEGMEVPPALQGLTVFQSANRLIWQEPSSTPSTSADSSSRVILDGVTDNSNTQFALLGLWVARRHEVAAESALEITVEWFERLQNHSDGTWMYAWDRSISSTSRSIMTGAGLIGLAIGRGLQLPTPGSPARGAKDVQVLRGLVAFSRWIGRPTGNMNRPMELDDPYFLWTLERVAMLYNLPAIRGKDWYRWGAECLVTNQKKDGWWPEPSRDTGSPEVSYRRYKATLCTSFALLFLKRSHPMKDLTAKLPFTAKELSEGITRKKSHDKSPARTTDTPSTKTRKEP